MSLSYGNIQITIKKLLNLKTEFLRTIRPGNSETLYSSISVSVTALLLGENCVVGYDVIAGRIQSQAATELISISALIPCISLCPRRMPENWVRGTI